MSILKTKKFIVWLCLGLYVLLGSTNLSTMTCFAMNPHQNSKVMSQPCSCGCMKDNSHSKSTQIANIDNCDCVKSNLPAGNIVQVNSSTTENIEPEKIANLRIYAPVYLSFAEKQICRRILNYPSCSNITTEILSTIVLRI